MAANSKHYGDVYLWLHKTIDSCTTILQLYSCRNLVRNFYSQYLRNPLHEHYDYENLRHYIDTRINNIDRLHGL